MTGDEMYTVSVRLDEEYPEEYKQRSRQSARERLAVKLLDYLYQPGKPIYTVRILDQEEQTGWRESEYRVWVELSRVQERHVQITVAHFEDMNWRKLSGSAIQEIERRITRKIKNVFGKDKKK